MGISLSGAILLYKEELINSFLYKSNNKTLPLSSIQKNINEFPTLTSISFPQKNFYYILNFRDKPSVYFDTLKGNEISHPIIKILSIISDFHHTLFLHKYLLVFFGFLLIYLIISGILIAKKYSIKKILSQKRVSFLEIHIILGLFFAPLLLLFVLSGTFLPLNKFIIKNAFSQSLIYPNVHIKKEDNKKINFKNIYNIVDTTIKEKKITRIYLPNKKYGEYKFRIKYNNELHPNGKSYILINPYTYEIIQSIDSRKHSNNIKFFQNIYTFHIGKIDNILNLLLVVLIILFFYFFPYLF